MSIEEDSYKQQESSKLLNYNLINNLLGTDMTLLSKYKYFNNLYIRESEVINLMEILSKKYSNNVLLIGKKGVGKKSIVYMFCNKITNNTVPFFFQKKIVISIDLYKLQNIFLNLNKKKSKKKKKNKIKSKYIYKNILINNYIFNINNIYNKNRYLFINIFNYILKKSKNDNKIINEIYNINNKNKKNIKIKMYCIYILYKYSKKNVNNLYKNNKNLLIKFYYKFQNTYIYRILLYFKYKYKLLFKNLFIILKKYIYKIKNILYIFKNIYIFDEFKNYYFLNLFIKIYNIIYNIFLKIIKYFFNIIINFYKISKNILKILKKYIIKYIINFIIKNKFFKKIKLNIIYLIKTLKFNKIDNKIKNKIKNKNIIKNIIKNKNKIKKLKYKIKLKLIILYKELKKYSKSYKKLNLITNKKKHIYIYKIIYIIKKYENIINKIYLKKTNNKFLILKNNIFYNKKKIYNFFINQYILSILLFNNNYNRIKYNKNFLYSRIKFYQYINIILKKFNAILYIENFSKISINETSSYLLDKKKSKNILNLKKNKFINSIFNNKEFQFITKMNLSEFNKDFKKNYEFFKIFTPLLIKEPNIKETFNILTHIRPELESYHNIEINNNILKLTIKLSKKYISNEFFPKKIIKILDIISSKNIIKKNYNIKNSIFINIINFFIKKLEKFRFESYRKGNILSEFIFLELKKIFKNILLKWINNPISLEINNINNLIPISNLLINNIKNIILYNIKNIIYYSFKKININDLNLSLYLYNIWNNKIIFNYNNIIYKYILNKDNNIDSILKKNKEKNKILIFKEFINNLKLILNNNFFNNYKKNFILKNKELKIIYIILKKFLNEKINDFYIWNYINNINNYKLKYKKNIITESDVYEYIKKIKKIDLKKKLKDKHKELEKMLNLEKILHKKLIGQHEAISVISNTLRSKFLNIKNKNKPYVSLFFCGPTGVGKTEIVKVLNSILYESETNLLRLDMSEFMEIHTVSKLIGSPPGYVGSKEGGILTNYVKENPESIILFDEMEKANPKIFTLLLQVLEDGRLTDGNKKLIDFTKTIIILTSNVGALEIQNILNKKKSKSYYKKELIKFIKKQKNIFKNNKKIINKLEKKKKNKYIKNIINYNKSIISCEYSNNIKNKYINFLKKKITTFKNFNYTKDTEKILSNINIYTINEKRDNRKNILKQKIIGILSYNFAPEFVNRFDHIIVFKPLKLEELRKICDIMIKNLIKRLYEKNILIKVTEDVKIKLCIESYNPKLGARPLRRKIVNIIENNISKAILREKIIEVNNFNVYKKIYKCIILLNDNKQYSILSQK